MKLRIVSRFNAAVLFEHDVENNTMKLTVEAAVKSHSNLRGAYLSGANLRGAYLSGAYLSGADLSGANLRGAYLSGAYLRGAYLSGADLRGADLRGADLRGEILTKTPITISNLEWEILITTQYLSIGCQRHTHAEWSAFSDDQIRLMHNNALAFWAAWKAPLLSICSIHTKE